MKFKQGIDSKIMIFLFVTPIAIGIIVAIAYPHLSLHLKVDKCLDSGGSFNYESCECDYKESHKLMEEHQCR